LVTSRMLLGDKEGVEVPKAGLNVSGRELARMAPKVVVSLPVGRHFFEAHLEEDLPELMPYFIQGM